MARLGRAVRDVPEPGSGGTGKRHAADIRAVLERQGQGIGGDAVLIAGHARSRGLALVTGTPRDFSRVAGLRSGDWLAGAG